MEAAQVLATYGNSEQLFSAFWQTAIAVRADNAANLQFGLVVNDVASHRCDIDVIDGIRACIAPSRHHVFAASAATQFKEARIAPNLNPLGECDFPANISGADCAMLLVQVAVSQRTFLSQRSAFIAKKRLRVIASVELHGTPVKIIVYALAPDKFDCRTNYMLPAIFASQADLFNELPNTLTADPVKVANFLKGSALRKKRSHRVALFHVRLHASRASLLFFLRFFRRCQSIGFAFVAVRTIPPSLWRVRQRAVFAWVSYVIDIRHGLAHHFGIEEKSLFSELAKAGRIGSLGNALADTALAGSNEAHGGFTQSKMGSGFVLPARPFDKGEKRLIGCFAICHVTIYAHA